MSLESSASFGTSAVADSSAASSDPRPQLGDTSLAVHASSTPEILDMDIKTSTQNPDSKADTSDDNGNSTKTRGEGPTSISEGIPSLEDLQMQERIKVKEDTDFDQVFSKIVCLYDWDLRPLCHFGPWTYNIRGFGSGSSTPSYYMIEGVCNGRVGCRGGIHLVLANPTAPCQEILVRHGIPFLPSRGITEKMFKKLFHLDVIRQFPPHPIEFCYSSVDQRIRDQGTEWLLAERKGMVLHRTEKDVVKNILLSTCAKPYGCWTCDDSGAVFYDRALVLPAPPPLPPRSPMDKLEALLTSPLALPIYYVVGILIIGGALRRGLPLL